MLGGLKRTGEAVTIVNLRSFHLVVQGWSPEDAIQEMTGETYGFHEVWIHLAPWIRGLDVEKMRKKLGITNSPGSEKHEAG